MKFCPDLRIVSEPSFVSLALDRFVQIGLDERQELANRLYKTLTKRTPPTTVEKLALAAQLHEKAQFDFELHFTDQPRTDRDRCRGLA